MPEARAVSAPRRTRNRQGEGGRLRDELIEAAGRILARPGEEEELSLRAVAREAGVAAPSVYLHFGNKDDLVQAVMLAHFAALRRTIEAAVEEVAAPGDRLRAGCLAYCRFALDRPGAYRVLFGRTAPAFTDARPPREIGMDVFAVLVQAIAACMASGEAPAGDPFRVATVVWTSLHGIVGLRRSSHQFPWPPLPELVDDVLVGLVGIARHLADGPRESLGRDEPTVQRSP